MSTYLEYLDTIEDKGNFVVIRLKESSSSRLSGNKIVEEIFRFLYSEKVMESDIEKKEEYLFQIKRHYPPKRDLVKNFIKDAQQVIKNKNLIK